MNHTPGPWTPHGRTIYANDKQIAVALNYCDSDINLNGDPMANITNIDESLANTRLIAAAPTMLSAIKDALQLHCFNCDDMTDEDHMIYETLLNALGKVQDQS